MSGTAKREIREERDFVKKHSPLLEEKLNPRTKLWRVYEKVHPDQT